MMMSRGVPFLLQGIPPSALESFKIQVEEEGNRYVIRGFLPGVRPQGMSVYVGGCGGRKDGSWGPSSIGATQSSNPRSHHTLTYASIPPTH